MAADRRTKAQLQSALKRAEAAHGEAVQELAAALQKLPPAPAAVPEAVALATCIRAIDVMQQEIADSTRPSSTMATTLGAYYSPGFVDGSSRHQSDVERLLRSLAAKYDVPLVEVRDEPCDRRHLDDLSSRELLAMVEDRLP